MQKAFVYIMVLIIAVSCKSPYQHTSGSNINISEIQTEDSLVNTDLVNKKIDSLKVLIKQGLVGQDNILNEIYSQNNYEPLWINPNLKWKAIGLLDSAFCHGLKPTDYNINQIKKLINKIALDTSFNFGANVELDFQITKSLFNFCEHLYYGKLKPNDYWFSWNYTDKSKTNGDLTIVKAIVNYEFSRIAEAFLPKELGYGQLVEKLNYFNGLGNTETRFLKYPGFILKQGDSNIWVYELKKALIQKKYIIADSVDSVFDSTLVDAIKTFQIQHGLNPDNKPGKRTYDFLNWNNKKYIDVIAVNLERLRWLNLPFPNNYVTVNIPEYTYNLVLNSKEVFGKKVIVGKYKNQTPVFKSAINYIVVNPCWTVPNSITEKKILPKLKKDSTYLKRNNMFVGLAGEEVDANDIDFATCSIENFPYKIYQRNGKGNALGKVKFMFDNKYSIYLHDTPSQKYFNKDNRALSHGCIRLQNAMDFAELLLYAYDSHNKKMQYYLNKGYPVKIYLKEPLPLMIQYFTCKYNVKLNEVQFFSDVYAKDYKVLVDLLKE